MKIRLDVALTELKLAKSRTAAQKIIQEGAVTINGKTALKPSETVDLELDKVIVSENPQCMKYVGRGGFKLEKAIESFDIELKGRICLDIGASTGGFTDCMLQNGAEKVFAVDVGSDQLDESLKINSKIISLEKLDIRKADKEIYEAVDFVSIDVSFISLKHILPEIKRFCAKKAEGVALIKPQFENGMKKNGKHGVIKDPKLHKKIVDDICCFSEGLGFSSISVIPSPIEGGDGNREFLMHFIINKKEE